MRDVAVIPGADTLEHIIENCALLTKLDVAPIHAPEPVEPLRKVYPVWPLMQDMICHTGTIADAGIFVVSAEDGKLRIGKDDAKIAAKAAATAELSAEQMKLLHDVGKAIGTLGIGAQPAEKRAFIDAHLNERASLAVSGQTAAVQARSAQPNAGKAHTISAGAIGDRNLTHMVVVPFTTWLAAGKIPRRGASTEVSAHVPVEKLRPGDRVVFFSQRWLTPVGDPASPDDAALTKYKACTAAARAWAISKGVAEEQLYLWIDYSCIEQDDVPELLRGVNSLGLYVCSADAFITIEHDAYFDRGWCLMECLFADASKVPRFLMTAQGELRPMAAEDRVQLKRPNQGNFTVEADRKIMHELEAMAQLITSQLERGGFALSADDHAAMKKIGSPKKALEARATEQASLRAASPRFTAKASSTCTRN